MDGTHKENLNADWIVNRVLDRWPATIPIFLAHRMACVGCSMARFNTLRDATRIYNLPVEGFLQELEQAIRTQEEA
jgi:hybrid cluster-associated redox disulfide protein